MKILKNKNQKVSVLIANYNNEKYIDTCINSLKKQTYKNLEIIFFDDQSNDNSLKKVKKFKNVNIVQSFKKKSIYGSINQINSYVQAFKKSKGKIILFLDSDDFFYKNKIEKIVKFFEKNRKQKIVFDLPTLIKNKKKIKIKPKEKFVKTYWPYIPNQSCIAIKREIFNRMISKILVNKFYDIWLDFRITIYSIYILKQFNLLNQNLTYYRKVENSASYKFQHLNQNWWRRRSQAHSYIKSFFYKNKISYKNNFDFYLTNLINFFLK